MSINADHDLQEHFGDYICGICLRLIYEPERLCSCQHIFCSICVDELGETMPLQCPICGIKIDPTKRANEQSIMIDRVTERMISSTFPQEYKERKRECQQLRRERDALETILQRGGSELPIDMIPTHSDNRYGDVEDSDEEEVLHLLSQPQPENTVRQRRSHTHSHLRQRSPVRHYNPYQYKTLWDSIRPQTRQKGRAARANLSRIHRNVVNAIEFIFDVAVIAWGYYVLYHDLFPFSTADIVKWMALCYFILLHIHLHWVVYFGFLDYQRPVPKLEDYEDDMHDH